METPDAPQKAAACRAELRSPECRGRGAGEHGTGLHASATLSPRARHATIRKQGVKARHLPYKLYGNIALIGGIGGGSAQPNQPIVGT